MARVVLAEDERLGRRVAVKAMHTDSLEDSAQRFEREARIGASLNHPNLVSVYDVVTDAESVLIVMEYVEGKTLKEAIAEGPLDRATAISVIGGVAGALDHAHKAGIVHRDVKPANILIREDGVAKLADLGIATAAENTRITSSGIVLGTAVYMAPEQLEGERPGPAADVYSLAAVAYEALSGKRARDGASPVELAHKAATRPPPDLLEAWPDAPPEAARALARGMCRDPGERQPSARALANELARSLLPPRALPAPPTPDADSDRTMPMKRTSVSDVRRTPPPPAQAAPPSRPAASPPRTQRGRRVPSWLPATTALVLVGVVGAVALASLGARARIRPGHRTGLPKGKNRNAPSNRRPRRSLRPRSSPPTSLRRPPRSRPRPAPSTRRRAPASTPRLTVSSSRSATRRPCRSRARPSPRSPRTTRAPTMPSRCST